MLRSTRSGSANEKLQTDLGAGLSAKQSAVERRARRNLRLGRRGAAERCESERGVLCQQEATCFCGIEGDKASKALGKKGQGFRGWMLRVDPQAYVVWVIVLIDEAASQQLSPTIRM